MQSHGRVLQGRRSTALRGIHPGKENLPESDGCSEGINGISNAIRSIPEIPGRIGNGIKRIGTVAGQVVGGGVKRLGSALLSLGGSALRGIASLPAKLLGIGKSAAAGTGGLNRMVRSIRNIGIVSLGLRVASGLFGQLRSIISNYVSQNEALNASVTSLKNHLGEALAPAINIVIAALQKLMPVVTSVANVVNSIFSTIFGNVTSTTAAITSSAEAAGNAAESLETYGFDQITKVSDNSGASSTASDSNAGSQSALVTKLTGWIQQLKAAFTSGDWAALGSTFSGGINSAIASINAIDIGSKVGGFINNVGQTLYSAVTTLDFEGIGKKAGELLGTAFEKIDWAKIGSAVVTGILGIPRMILGFVGGVNWGQVASGLFKGLGTALGTAVSAVASAIGNVVTAIGNYFAGPIGRCGGNVAKGLLLGIVEGFSNIVSWIWTNVVSPFIEGFKSLFKINSPSVVMKELGMFLGEGVLSGFREKWQNILTLLSEGLRNIRTKFTEAWTNCSAITTQKWNEVSQKFTTKVTEIQSAATERFQGIRENIVTAWTDIQGKCTTAISAITSGAVSGFGKMRTGVASAFSGMWTSVKSWINKLIGGVESMANNIIRGVNKLIDGLNEIGSIGKKVGLNVSISKVATVSLPRLEYGGVITGPTQAIIGEAGKEVVLPLQRHTGWMDALVNKIREGGNVSDSGTPLIIQIMLGSRKVTEYFIKDINQITRTTGVCPIKV